MKAHPKADLFPLLEGDEFNALVDSVKANGLINPIILCQGQILDGRNRFRACQVAGVEPSFMEFDTIDEKEQAAIIDALNMKRRHLTPSQRAMIAARLHEEHGLTTGAAAKEMGISGRTVTEAIAVQRSGDTNIIDMVARGKVSASKAAAVVRGEAPATVLHRDGRGSPGRPRGSSQVTRLRKALVLLLDLESCEDRIIKNWPGDPDLNAQLSKGIEFLSFIQSKTQEPDHAVARA